MIKFSQKTRQVARTDFDYIPFGFGLDLVTPSNMTKPGSLRECRNYEININGGYTGIAGYEAFDGRPSPSEAIYYRLNVSNITGGLTVGAIVTDAFTGGFGTVIAINTEFDPGQAHIVLAKVTGVLGDYIPPGDPHNITIPGPTIVATTDGIAVASGAQTSLLDAQYKNLAADLFRADIGIVPGAGSVLGVWVLNDTVYAFRNHTDNLSAKMWKSSVAGWVEIALGLEMAFTSGGLSQIYVGDTITGNTSLATAVITGVATSSGSWGSGTAAGNLFMLTKTGNFTPGEPLSITGAGGADVATVTANAQAITLEPNGQYEFYNYNFGGLAGAVKMYGVDGVNNGFEFNDANGGFVRITTGMQIDAPTHVVVHKNHLFYSFDGSVQHSAIGDPYNFTAILGAGELAVGDTVTAFSPQPGTSTGGALAILSRNRIHILYGSSAGQSINEGWELVQYREEVGAFANTVEEFGMTLMLDDRGIIKLDAVQDYGNFGHNLVSRLIQPYLNTRKVSVKAACIARDKAQYRLFFGDGSALYITTDNKSIMGIMKVNFPTVVERICSLEAASGAEAIYFGSTDGFIYQMERGTSFNGVPIDRNLTLHFHHGKSARVEKTYFDASFELSGAGYAEFYFSYQLDYNLPTTPQPASVNVGISFASSLWDTMTWDSFVWDGSILAPSTVDLNGSGENISFVIRSTSDFFAPLTFSGVQIRQAIRKQLRS